MPIPKGHTALKGSEHGLPLGAKALGSADPKEAIAVRVIVRRRTDVAAAADLAVRLSLHPALRGRLSEEEHARRFGAAQADLDAITNFLTKGGLQISRVHGASRTIIATGTAAQLSALFSVTLQHFETPDLSGAAGSGTKPRLLSFRGLTGSIHVPAEIADLIVGVFGLDNRPIGGRNNNGDPPTISTTTVPQVAQRYQFPANSAAGQTLGIFAQQYAGSSGLTGGYSQADINSYYAATALQGFTAPIPVDVTDIDGTQNNAPFLDSEATQDICIASTVAQGATIAVYFNQGNQNGWLGVLNKVAFPLGTDPKPSVLSISPYAAPGDDTFSLTTLFGYPTSFLDAMTLAFQDAAGQGVTVCVASGDSGSTYNYLTRYNGQSFNQPVPAQQVVSYPASDPYVLACGGTTLGANSSGTPVEWVWNDASFYFPGSPPSQPQVQGQGATGGGVSAYFAQPSWQIGVGVPKSLVDGHVGRGVPDVAANASPNSGYYPMYTTGNFPNPWNGNGTSAAAPLYAGLFAVINAALGYNVGFINPILYALGNAVCKDVDPAVVGGPANNAVPPPPKKNPPPANLPAVAGYAAGHGWDACTGWGSINGNALLAALKAPEILQQQCTFIVDRSTYGKDEVDALLKAPPAGTNGVINPALWVTVDGYTPGDLNISALSTDPNPANRPNGTQLKAWAPTITSAPALPASFQYVPVAVSSDNPSLPMSVQRFTFTYEALFTNDSAFASIPTGQQQGVTLTAQIQNSMANASILLVNEPNPFITNGATSWLSIDLRVFSILAYETRFNANLNSGPNNFIKTAIANLTAGKGATQTGLVSDTFNSLPVDEEPNIFVYPTTYVGGTQVKVYNFAIARVRYRDLINDATNVRVFFRAFQAQSTTSNYDQSTTFRRAPNHESPAQPVPLLGTDQPGMSATEFVTIAFFADPRIDITQLDMTWQTDDTNIWKTIKHDPTGAEVDTFFGCWLDLNQTGSYPNNLSLAPTPQHFSAGNLNGKWAAGDLAPIQQAMTRNPHQCLVAEVALDSPAIPAGATPSTSDKLAQRNLGWSDLAS